jgi:hypothetical protein
MQPAFEMSFALWGMIVCVAIEADQILQSLFDHRDLQPVIFRAVAER